MDKKKLGIAAIVLGAAYYFNRVSDAFNTSGTNIGSDNYSLEGYGYSQGGFLQTALDSWSGVWDAVATPAETYLMNPDLMNTNVQAFLKLIRSGESSNGSDAAYRILNGGKYLPTNFSFADHPTNLGIKWNGASTAAGAYQFVIASWNEVKSRLNLPDFSPTSQDAAAIYTLKYKRKAIDDIKAGRFATAIKRCINEWTSLPGGIEQQYNLATAKQRLISYGATVTDM